MEPGLSILYLGPGTGIKGKICQANSSLLTPPPKKKIAEPAMRGFRSQSWSGDALCHYTRHHLTAQTTSQCKH